MKVHYLQHVQFENPGYLLDLCEEKGFELSSSMLFLNEGFPEITDFEVLIVMGGPMNIYEYEKYEWLKSEKKFIKNCIDAGKIVIGICLGAQLIADVLGAKVYSGEHKEIGWMPINKVDDHAITAPLPSSFTVMHWHGDTFEIPQGAVHLFESGPCRNQGFLYKDHVLGLQFHLEMKQENVASIVQHCSDELVEATYIQKGEEILSNNNDYNSCQKYMRQLFEWLCTN